MTPEEIRRLAALARLDLTEEEVGRMAGELASILSHMGALRRVAPRGPEPPTGGAVAPTPLRPDRIDFDPLARPPEELAPAWAEGFFVVPRLPALDDPDGEEKGG